jgi:hypothetical protein
MGRNAVRHPTPSGVYEVVVDARTLPSGVYYYTLSAGRYVDTKRLVLIR